MAKIVILGVFVADTTYRADRAPRMGETILGNAFSLGPGGKGSNQAVAAARLGGEVAFISRLGRDAFGEIARKVWAEAGVEPHVIDDTGAATGAANIFVEEASGDNAIIICPGAAMDISAEDITRNAALIAGADLFMTQLEQPMEAAMAGLETARGAGVRTLLNPAPAAPLPDGMLALCDYVTPNESEAEALTGIPVESLEDAERAARALADQGVRVPVITLGARGVLVFEDGRATHVPARAAGPVVETTGAGDAFNGAFATGLSEGMDTVAAAEFGCAVAGISVTRPGAAASMPVRGEVPAS